MTPTNHLVPPPDLRRQWLDNDHFPMVTGTNDLLSITRDRLNSVIDQAAQWGADQELEACCEWLCEDSMPKNSNRLRNARRPKPPSLKEQALAALREAYEMANDRPPEGISNDQIDTIRRALEALPND